mgnify:CR=1 FL=1
MNLAKMTRLLFILCVLFITGNLFGQSVSSSAFASATILSPVGAEKTSDIIFEGFSTVASQGTIISGADGIQKSSGGIKFSTDKSGAIASLNIIGGSSEYNITVQSDPIILNNNAGKKILAKLFTLSSYKIQPNNLNLMIGASITVDAFQKQGSYTSPFAVTINFN